QALHDEAVGDRTYGETEAALDNGRAQLRVLQGIDAVVDPVHSDRVQTLMDVSQRVLLIHVAVHRQPVAELPRLAEDFSEFSRRIALLVRIEAHPHAPTPEWKRFLQGRQSGLGAQVSQKTQDELGGDAQLCRGTFL